MYSPGGIIVDKGYYRRDIWDSPGAVYAVSEQRFWR